jgi:hypothetical protein
MKRANPHVLAPAEYRREKRRKALVQGLRCANCGSPNVVLDNHHPVARGMGGGWRRDTKAGDTSRTANRLLCRKCHEAEPYSLSKFTGEPRKNSKRP